MKTLFGVYRGRRVPRCRASWRLRPLVASLLLPLRVATTTAMSSEKIVACSPTTGIERMCRGPARLYRAGCGPVRAAPSASSGATGATTPRRLGR